MTFSRIAAAMAFALIAVAAGNAHFIDFAGNSTVYTGQNLTITGTLYSSDGTTPASATVTTTAGSNTNFSGANSTGHFNLTVTVPATPGEYNVTINTTEGSKTFPIFVTNITGGAASFAGAKKPPFSAGDSFLLNISQNAPNGSNISLYLPNIRIFKADGARVLWNITNYTGITRISDNSTYIIWNVSIPSSESGGTFIVSADGGKIRVPIVLSSAYVMALGAQTTANNETRLSYAPGTNVTFIAIVRTTGGTLTNATSISARIALPNGTSASVVLANTTTEGRYEGTYVLASGIAGTFTFTASATVGGETISGTISLTASQARAYLETQEDFYQRFGEKRAITAGNTIALNIVATNLSDNSIFSGSATGGTGLVNCTDGTGGTHGTKVIKITASNGSSISAGITYDSNGFRFMNPVCRIQFTAPNETGTYRIDFNTTIGGQANPINLSGIGYIEVQNFLLGVTPSRAFGAGGSTSFGDFASMYAPGTNITFSLAVFSLKNGVQIGGGNITSIRVARIRKMDFMSGAREFIAGVEGGTASFNVTNFTLGSKPTVTIMIPINQTGAFQADIEVNVLNLSTTSSNETVKGSGFYIAKRLMGWLSASEGFAACGRTVNFTGSAYDMASGQAVDGITVENIISARKEPEGRDISSCVSMQRTTANGTGYISVPVTINNTKGGCTDLSEGNMIIFNVTYKGTADEIPSWFMCREYWFWTQTTPWRVAPRGTVNLSIGGDVRRVSNNSIVSSGTLKVNRVMAWSPGSGGQVLALAVTVNGTYTGPNTTALQLSPANVSRTAWPEGFVSLTMQFCDPSGTCDNSWGGFQVAAFDAYIQNAPWGTKLGKGENVSLIIQAATNVSRDSGNYSGEASNITIGGFNATAGPPWGGRKVPASLVGNAVLLEDRWNGTNDTGYPNWGFEKWNVTVNLPSDLEKGQNVVTIKVRNYANETATVEFWFQVENYEVVTLRTERVDVPKIYSTNADNATLLTLGFNMSILNNTLNVSSKSGIVCAVQSFNATPGYSTFANSYGNETIRLMLVDNATSGVYDTVVFNNTADSQYTIKAKFDSFRKIYIHDFVNCNEFLVVNSTTSDYNYWAGDYEVDKNFTLAYRVKRATGSRAPASGATLSIDSVISQFSGGGAGAGYGFQSKLDSGTNYVQSSGTTDANGIAFLGMNVSEVGWYSALWKLTDGATEDRASFGNSYSPSSVGSSFSVRAMTVWGQRVSRLGGAHRDESDSSHANVVLTLANSLSRAVWNYTADGNVLYNGTFIESAGNAQYIRDNCLYNGINATTKLYAIWGPRLRVLVLDNDNDMNTTIPGNDTAGAEYLSTGCTSGNLVNWTGEVSINSTAAGGWGSKVERLKESGTTSNSISMQISAFRSNSTHAQAAIYEFEGPDSNTWYNLNHSTMNVTVAVCAQTVSRPITPLENATLYLELETWSYGGFGPGTVTNTALAWFDPINGTKYTFGPKNATTGPQGCVALDVVHPSGWSSNFWGSIKGTIRANISGTMRTENTWVGSVNRWSTP